ncbi:MAG TPA: tetratricopeptide repeat protein [Polyangia bacterium]|nr:tetratricopeptide repeat protein [Polyangia bacterium]
MIRSHHIALLSISLACVGMVVLPAGRAFAQDQAVVDKLVQMNKKALGDYDTLEWDTAKRTLLDALVAGKKAGLDDHPIMARTYIHLAAVYLTGFKDRAKAMQSFARALEIDPTIQLSKGIESGEVSAAFAEAQRKAGGGGSAGGGDSAPPPSSKRRRKGPVMEGDTPPPEHARRKPGSDDDDDDGGEPDLPAHIAALDCPTPDEAIIDKPLTLRCALAPSLPVASVFLLYRAPGKEDYTEVAMTKTPKGWLQAKVPKKAVDGKSFQFYFEGRNAAGKPVVANGGADSPNIILVVEKESQHEVTKAKSGDEEDENPLEDQSEGGSRSPRLHLGHIDKAREGLDTRFGKRKWWIGLGLGSGYGYAKGNGFEAVNKSPDPAFHMLQGEFVPGLAWAGLGHLAPEVGYQLSPDVALAVEGRLQWTGQPAKYSQFAAQGAIGVLAKLVLFTKQSQLRFFGSALAGGGQFRMVVYPAAGQAMDSDFKDTVVGGFILAGLGGGLNYEATKAVSLVAEMNALAGLPTFSVVLDLNVALQINIY